MKSSATGLDVGERYETLIPMYQELVKEVQFALDREIQAANLRVTLSDRVKTLESLLEKIERKHYHDPLIEITDLAGVRAVCQFTSDAQEVEKIVRRVFAVVEEVDKAQQLKADRMGYLATHFIVQLSTDHRGPRYDYLKGFKCEIQVKTILQDAWAQIDHSLMYKSKTSIPERERRELNNVASLLEIAQSIFDRTRETRAQYVEEIQSKMERPIEFLQEPINRDTLALYTQLRYPTLPVNSRVQEILLGDLDTTRYKTLNDIERTVLASTDAVAAYQREAPDLFGAGTDYITKSLGFADPAFRARHGFGPRTREAISKFETLVKAQTQ